MRISKIISEISNAERRQNRKEKNKMAFLDKTNPIVPVKPASKKVVKQVSEPSDNQPTGIFSDPRLDSYRVDPTVDTDFEGGFYLNFAFKDSVVYAYWSKGDLSFENCLKLSQVKRMGISFNSRILQELIDHLVEISSKGNQKGYVNVAIPTNMMTHPYVSGLYEYMMRRYRQGNDELMDPNVYWELI